VPNVRLGCAVDRYRVRPAGLVLRQLRLSGLIVSVDEFRLDAFGFVGVLVDGVVLTGPRGLGLVLDGLVQVRVGDVGILVRPEVVLLICRVVAAAHLLVLLNRVVVGGAVGFVRSHRAPLSGRS
jgi:hypothetical protein